MTWKQFCTGCTCTTTQSQAACPGKTMPAQLNITVTTNPVVCLNNFTDVMTCSVSQELRWYSGQNPLNTLTFCQNTFIGAGESSYFGMSCTFGFNTGTGPAVGYFIAAFNFNGISFGTPYPGFQSDAVLSCNPFHYRLTYFSQGFNTLYPVDFRQNVTLTFDVTEP